MKVEDKYGYLIVDEKYFQVNSKDGKSVWREVDKKKIKDMENKAIQIAKKLKDSLDKEKVLKEAVMQSGEKEITILYNLLFKSNKKYKPKTREHHCVDIKIGNFILPIVE